MQLDIPWLGDTRESCPSLRRNKEEWMGVGGRGMFSVRDWEEMGERGGTIIELEN